MKHHDKINWMHLWRYLTSQPSFVWDKNPASKIDVEEDELNIWDFDLNFEENNDVNLFELLKPSFEITLNKAKEYVKNEALYMKKNISQIIEAKPELASKQTINFMNDSSVDWILNPVILFDNVISRPFLIKKNSKNHITIYILLLKKKTSLKNYVELFFNYNVFKKQFPNMAIDELKIICFSSKKLDKANDVSFVETKFCSTSKDGYSGQKNMSEQYLGFDPEKENKTILEKIESNVISLSKKIEKNIKFDHFDFYIKKILQSKKEEFISIDKRDNTIWGTNKKFNEYYNFKKNINLDSISGKIFKKEKLIEISYDRNFLNDFLNNDGVYMHLLKRKMHINKNLVSHFISRITNSKCVWYDFEGFSMPYTLVPKSMPYSQVVFQVSVIFTNQMEIDNIENLVFDPKDYQYRCFINIVNAIHKKDASHYIVYNKSYENARLKEMKEVLISLLNDKNKLQDVIKKIDEIIEKTIDLCDLFYIGSNKVLPHILLPESNGFYSIKKIEIYISEKNIELPLKITPYKNLEVKNGLMAMNKAIQRKLGSIGDKEWSLISENLKKYCENDVKAMIMTYYFVIYLLNNSEEQI